MNTPKRARIVTAGSSSSYSLRERPKQKNLFKSKSSVYSLRKTENRGRPFAGPSSLFTPKIDKTLIKKINRGRTVAAGLSSSYSLRGRPKKNDTTNREKENVFGSKMVYLREPMEDYVSGSVNDDVPQLMEVNVSKSKKDDGTTEPLLPKLKRFNINELRDLTLENDRHRLKYSQRIHVLETEAIQDDYRIKNLAVKTANCSDRSAFNEPYDVNFEIQERDRIFSGTSASFQPKNIFESSDDEESEAN